jgi:hypothetical protein
MNPPRTVGQQFREHLFVLAWVVLAVIAKYSVSLPNSAPSVPTRPDAEVATIVSAPGLNLDE